MIRRSLWQVLVWFILPLAVAILAGIVEESPHRLFIERDGMAVIAVFILAIFGFMGAGIGLSLGSLFRALIKRISPKT